MKQRFYKTLIVNFGLLLILLSYYLISSKTGFYIPCIFRLITGYKCPGCGITTYLFDIINFKFKDAFLDNPLVFILIPFALVYYVISIYNYIKYDDRYRFKLTNCVWYGLIVITILFGIFRNIFDI